MITHEQLLAAMATALLADAALAAWVTATCPAGDTLHVQIGEDGANPPTAEDGPVVILTPFPRGSDLGEDVSDRSYRIEVDWLIKDETKDTTTPGLTLYRGVYTCDQLGQLVYSAVLGISQSVTISRANYGIDAALTWPLCQGGMTVYIDVPNIIGAEIAL